MREGRNRENAGSPCGADIGDRLSSTIGYERRFNAFLQFEEEKAFTEYALSTAPPTPTYYPRMKKVNAEGPEILRNLPVVCGLPPELFREAIGQKDHVLIDTRMMLGCDLRNGGLVAGSWVFAELSGWSKRTVGKWGDLGKVLLPDLLRAPRTAFFIGLAAALITLLLVLESFTIR